MEMTSIYTDYVPQVFFYYFFYYLVPCPDTVVGRRRIPNQENICQRDQVASTTNTQVRIELCV